MITHMCVKVKRNFEEEIVMIRLCAFADEADSKVDGQIAALKRNGIGLIELRGLDGTNVSALTEEQAMDYAKRFEDAGIKVWSIGSPLGKAKISEDFEEYSKLVRHVCKLANIFGADKIRMFSFFEAYESEDKVIDNLRRMVAIAAEYGVILCHENEKEIFGDTLERVLKLAEAVPELRLIYDPANYLEVSENPDITLEELHARTEYFHIKDVISATGELVPAGYGDGRIGDIIARIDPNEDKVLTIEPHLAIFEGFSEIDNTVMKNKFHFDNNNESFDAAVSALKGILAKLGYKETEGGFTK